MAENPFRVSAIATAPDVDDEPAFSRHAFEFVARPLWDLLAEQPNKTEAAKAQRLLEQCIQVAKRAAEPAPRGS